MTDAPIDNLAELWRVSSKAHATRPLFGVKSAVGWRWLTYSDVAAQVDAKQSTKPHIVS